MCLFYAKFPGSLIPFGTEGKMAELSQPRRSSRTKKPLKEVNSIGDESLDESSVEDKDAEAGWKRKIPTSEKKNSTKKKKKER